MSRAKMPGSLKVGNTESPAQKKERHEVEQSLMGNKDVIYLVPENLDNLSKIYYQFIIDELKSVDILSNVDQPLIEQTAICLSTIKQCDERISQFGLFYEEMDRYGHTKTIENVAVKTKLNYLTKYKQFCDSLGMSPSARASLAAKKIEAQEQIDDPVLQILKGNV